MRYKPVQENLLHCLLSIFVPSHAVSIFEHALCLCCCPPSHDRLQDDHSVQSFQPDKYITVFYQHENMGYFCANKENKYPSSNVYCKPFKFYLSSFRDPGKNNFTSCKSCMWCPTLL